LPHHEPTIERFDVAFARLDHCRLITAA